MSNTLWNECFGGEDLTPYPSDDEGKPHAKERRDPTAVQTPRRSTRKKKPTKPTTTEKPGKKRSTKRTARKENEARESGEVKKKREKTRRIRRRLPRRSQFDETYSGLFRSDSEAKAHPNEVVFTGNGFTIPAMAWTMGKDGRLVRNPNVTFSTPRAERPEESIETRWMWALREDKKKKDDYVARMNIDDDDDDDVEPQSSGQRLGPEGTIIID